MYYEEKIIDGRLHYRTTPRGEWRVKAETPTKVNALALLLTELTDEERMEIFSRFCVGCGNAIKPCYCMRDD